MTQQIVDQLIVGGGSARHRSGFHLSVAKLSFRGGAARLARYANPIEERPEPSAIGDTRGPTRLSASVLELRGTDDE